MSIPNPSRRTFLKAPLALSALTLPALAACDDAPGTFPKDVTVPSSSQPEPKPYTPTTSVSITQFGGSTTAKDNGAAINQALQKAGRGGEVTVPAGTFAVTTPVTWPNHPVRLRGLGSGNEATTLAFGDAVVHGISVQGNAVGGSWISNVTLTGASSAQIFLAGAATQQLVVDGCTFVDPATYGAQVDTAYLYVRGSRFMGPGDGSATAVHAMKSDTKVTAKDTQITGCFRGLYCAGVGDLTAQGVTVNAMWWCGNAAKNATTLASADASSLTTRSGVTLSGAQNYTVTAWKQLSNGATLTPVGGKQGWYTLGGVSGVEPRMMLRTPELWGTVLEVNGSQVRVHSFYEWKTCHPVSAPAGPLRGVTVERPYIAGLTEMSGTQATIADRWKTGGRASAEVPPAGARVQIVPAADYQIFGTDGTKSLRATECTVLNSWADSISTIASSNAFIAKNDIWDSQDVGVTIQQGKGACRVEDNTMHRIGTAGVFIGTSEAQVVGNSINGAQHTAIKEDSYAALQIEGAEKVAVWKNEVTYGGSPFELRAMIIEGRYGPYPQADPKKGPFATDGYYKENVFRGYPKELTVPAPSTEKDLEMAEVTVRGKHASAKIGEWAKGTRVQALDGADKAKIHA